MVTLVKAVWTPVGRKGFLQAQPCCRFRFQCETGGVRELKALREMSPAAFSVSIETGSAFFRFQLGLIDHLIDRTMNPCRGASKTQMIPVGLRLSAALFSYAAC